MKNLLLFSALFFLLFKAQSQNVGIGTTTPAGILDVVSTTNGVLFPRLTTVQMNAIVAPANGLMITNVDSANRLFIYTGAGWKGLSFTNEGAVTDTALLVHKAGTETITGAKTFEKDIKVNGLTVGSGAGNIPTNTAVGKDAFRSNTTGNYNTSNGGESLYSNTTGSWNTAGGFYSLYSNTTGNYNTGIGTSSLESNTAGQFNSALGEYALYSNTSGNYNTGGGGEALYSNTTGSWNTSSGFYSLYYNTTGNYNTGIGTSSLESNTTGQINSALGEYALYSNTTGNYNTSSGGEALYSNTTGSWNTSSGFYSLYYNTTGNYNTGIGTSSLESNTTGRFNSALGEYSLYSNTTGDSNTVVGGEALYYNTTGSNNIAGGNFAGSFIADGTTPLTKSDRSIFIGDRAKGLANDQTNQIVIGYAATGLGSNTAVIGNDAILLTSLKGQVGINNPTPAVSAQLDISSTTKGVLLPRMTKTQRNAIVGPVEGLIIYQTDNTPGLRVYNGTNWVRFTETVD